MPGSILKGRRNIAIFTLLQSLDLFCEMDEDVNGNVAVSFKFPSNPVWFFFAPHEYYSITRL
jgi:hypothetical protein